MTKKELIKQKAALTHEITNIRADYKHLSKEDMPEEIVAELASLMVDLKALREELEAMS